MNNSTKLNQLLGIKPDTDLSWYLALTNKMKSESGIDIKVKIGNLKFSSNKMNFKSAMSELWYYFKPNNVTSTSLIDKSYKVGSSFRENLEKIPLCFDDEIQISVRLGKRELFSQKILVENFKENFEVKCSSGFVEDVLKNQMEVIINLRLLSVGTSRKILEKELNDTTFFLDSLLKKSVSRVLGIVDGSNAGKVPSSKMSKEMLRTRFELFGFNVSLANLEVFSKRYLQETLTVFDFDNLSVDFLSKTETIRKFSKQISNESLLEESIVVKKYREQILNYIKQLENSNELDFTHCNIDLSVGEE